MKKTATHKAYAKINLALSLTGKKDGMHTIDSIVTNIGVYDAIKAEILQDGQMSVTYSGLTERLTGDSAKTMAELIQKEFGTPGADFFIKKRIPMSAGLGGSSADAAGVAHCMQKLFDLPSIPLRLLLEAGSDVPYMYEGGNKRVRGTGELITDVTLPKARYAVLVCPGGVSTAEAYALYDKIGGQNADIDELLRDMRGGTYVPFNALQRAAESLNANISTGIDLLRRAGFSQAVMSGSGSSVVAAETNSALFRKRYKTLRKALPQGYTLYNF
ncbi:MAG: hypothetical protein PHC84_05715 [Clostridia bacterium]|nr:hypothetical protein [Clostridia bacterium]